jgi:2-C-methyl-D-erythritol 4-phosphate cytidylyltransferase / 2-C-methyl-D-erythritol 2,4-cyclodiphosphate synthase
MSVTALLVAAGSGQRLGGGVPKQFRPIAGKPMVRWAAEAFRQHPRVDAVRIVIGEDQQALADAAFSGLEVGPMIVGGAERSDSVRNGLKEVAEGIVLVHDAARPFCPPAVVDALLAKLTDHDGAVPVLPVRDTIAQGDGLLTGHLDRSRLLRVQTPQAFHVEDLLLAYEEAGRSAATDESSVMVAAGLKVATVEGDALLDKITTQSDYERAESILAGRFATRTGMGFDVHGFTGVGPVMLGGIAIPSPRGLAGHSDADVVLHAITDALLGAASLGDIGEHFPPSDPRWAGAPSDLFLAHAAGLIRADGGVIDHIDCTIICEEPKVGPHRSAMRTRVAEILELDEAQVSIKATTTEGLGFTGRREGIAAQAIASIRMGLVR